MSVYGRCYGCGTVSEQLARDHAAYCAPCVTEQERAHARRVRWTRIYTSELAAYNAYHAFADAIVRKDLL